MRDVVPHYRMLFPAIITDAADGDDGLPRYAWTELTPAAQGAYEIQPGARSGTTSLNWARELEDNAVEVGVLVWMRHRDEDGQLHFEFAKDAPLSLVPPPPPGSGSGSGSLCPACCGGVCLAATLCLEVLAASGDASPLAGRYALSYRAPTKSWAGTHPAGRGYLDAGLSCASEAPGSPLRLVLGLRGLGAGDSVTVAGSPFTVAGCVLPWESGTVTLSGALSGTLRLRLTEGACDDCTQTIGGEGTLCFGDKVVLHFGNTQELTVVSAVCPVFTEIDLGSLVGSPGPKGDKGDPGATGSTGATGSAGSTGATGSPGADGAPGSVWRDGTGAPSSGLGINGDYYLNDATGDVYLKASGTYSIVANVKGGTGATGSAGSAGATGPAGPNTVTAATTTDLTGYLKGDGASVSAVSSIPNADLAHSSLTVTAGTNLAGGGVVSLGGAVTLSAPGVMLASNNLSDLANVGISRSNIGLGAMALLADPLTETHGGTGRTTYALGDVLYASASNTLAKLAGNTAGTKKFLRQTGTGTVSAAPAWDVIAAADVPVMVAAGGSHAVGVVPDPGSTSHSNNPQYLGDDAAWHAILGYLLGSSYVGTQQSTASTTPVDLATAQSATFTLDASTDVIVRGYAAYVNTGVGGATGVLELFDGATDLGVIAQAQGISTTGTISLVGAARVTLAAGAHTLHFKFYTTAGTGFFSQRAFTAERAS